MGRQSEPIINHFSHQHPLHLTNPQPSRVCSACKQTLETEPLYTCRSPSCTTFSIHLKCSHLPHRITHPCHHIHPLSLLPKSHNSNGFFVCNACGNDGDGFSYICKDCGVSIHVVCATLPLCLSHQSHSHQLGLAFASPYATGGFSCDVCGVIEGGKCWLYRCGSCGFDVHLSCATSKRVGPCDARHDQQLVSFILWCVREKCLCTDKR
ncbi:putative chromatin regulator PHD family [Helianthus anomalus]